MLPLKTVAERVGYRYVTNFINAFAARYGTPPRQFAGDRADSGGRTRGSLAARIAPPRSR